MAHDRVAQQRIKAAGRGLAVPHIKITAVTRLAPPFLAFKRRDVRREVRGVVQKIDAERAVLHSQAGDGGIITIRHIPAAEQPLLKCAEHGAVREDGNRFAGIRGGNAAQRCLKARGKLLPRLAALDVPVNGVVVELFEQLRLELLQLAEGMVFPAAETVEVPKDIYVQKYEGGQYTLNGVSSANPLIQGYLMVKPDMEQFLMDVTIIAPDASGVPQDLIVRDIPVNAPAPTVDSGKNDNLFYAGYYYNVRIGIYATQQINATATLATWKPGGDSVDVPIE